MADQAESSLTTVAFSNTGNANGGSISGATLTLSAATATQPGGIQASGAQTLGATLTLPNNLNIDGVIAGIGSSSGAQNTGLGNGAMHTAGTYSGSTAIGFDALYNANGTSAQGYNTAVGAYAGIDISGAGTNNTLMGYQAAYEVYAGLENAVFGSSAQYGNGSGPFNVSYVTAVGYKALNVNTGNYNSAFGHLALADNSTGTYNLAFGTGVLPVLTTGSYNTAAGANTGGSLVSGSYEWLEGPWVDAATATESDTMRILNGLIGTGLSSPTVLYHTPVATFKLGIGAYPSSLATLTLVGGNQTPLVMNTLTGPPSTYVTVVHSTASDSGTYQIPSASGSFTCTPSNTLNVSAATITDAYYSQNNQIVTVTVSGSVTTTTALLNSQITLTLPISTAQTGAHTYGPGTVVNSGTSPNQYSPAIVELNNSTSVILFFAATSTAGSSVFTTTFQYHL